MKLADLFLAQVRAMRTDPCCIMSQLSLSLASAWQHTTVSTRREQRTVLNPPQAQIIRSTPAPATTAPALDPKLERMLVMLERLFGRGEARALVERLQRLRDDLMAIPQQARLQWNEIAGGSTIVEEVTRIDAERESAALVATGTLTTDDGHQIDFHVDYRQSTESITLHHSARSSRSAPEGQPIDPLALDLDMNGLGFSDERMDIDLDLDGLSDSVHRLSPGDVWLVLDGNHNGQVDDGSELFGPRSGQAFAELAALDDDGNGVVDANDSAWADLKVWNGGRLRSLAEAGLAGLATAAVALPFAHRSDDGSLAALGRQGGVWIGRDGQAGAALAVDLVA